MRSLAGLAIAFGVSGVLGVATGAAAQATVIASDSAALLMNAAFSRDEVSDAAFGAERRSADPVENLLNQGVYQPGLGPTRWNLDQVVSRPNADGSAVDTLKVSVGGALRTPGGLPLNLERGQFDAKAYEIRLVRDWPAAVTLENELYDLQVSPHAGLGVSSFGNSAEAGAMVTLGRKSQDQSVADRLDRMGVRDGAAFGDTGRWYLFAAASGRAVGFNMARDAANGLDRSWSQDSSSALIGDAQLGVGWRKGAMQTSLGYVHREVKGAHMLWGQEAKDDSMVAFSLSIKPRH